MDFRVNCGHDSPTRGTMHSSAGLMSGHPEQPQGPQMFWLGSAANMSSTHWFTNWLPSARMQCTSDSMVAGGAGFWRHLGRDAIANRPGLALPHPPAVGVVP